MLQGGSKRVDCDPGKVVLVLVGEEGDHVMVAVEALAEAVVAGEVGEGLEALRVGSPQEAPLHVLLHWGFALDFFCEAVHVFVLRDVAVAEQGVHFG